MSLRRERASYEKLEEIFQKITHGFLSSHNKEIPSVSPLSLRPPILDKQEEARLRQLVYILKKDGLIATQNENEKKLYHITASGRHWLETFQKRLHPRPPLYIEKAQPHNAVTIVSYDVPERIGYLRNWLRESLRNFGLTQMQRSVWIGKLKLPEQFLKDIAAFRLTSCVEIFEITKAGTLRHRI